MSSRKLASSAVLVALAVVAVVVLLRATQAGIGVYSDSVCYLRLARRFLDGHGFTLFDIDGTIDPVPRFPPVYPTFLALPGFFHADILQAARWSHALLLAACVVVFGLILRRHTRGSTGASLTGAALFLATFDVLLYHSIALSEALFLLLGLLAYLQLLVYAETASKKALLATSVLTGLALVTRYSGAALVLAGCCVLLGTPGRTIREKVRSAAVFSVIGCLPICIWIIRNLRYTKGATGRHITVRPFFGRAELSDVLDSVARWALNGYPADGGQIALGAAAVAVAVLLALAAFCGMDSADRRASRLAQPATYAVCYGVTLIASAALVQGDLFLDSSRILLPFHVFLLLLLIVLASDWNRRHRSIRVRAVFVLCVAALALNYATAAARWIEEVRQDGQGYAGVAFKQSPLVGAVRQLPAAKRVYSNLPWPIDLYADRVWGLLPAKVDTSTKRPSLRYGEELAKVVNLLSDGTAVLAFFETGDDWFALPSIEEIQARVPLRVIATTEDGTLYEASRR